MKKRILLFAIALLPFFSKAQTAYQYIPMDLDTSSVWVHDFFCYSGGSGAAKYTRAEMISYVEKDTIINNKTYSKIIGYVSKLGVNDVQWCLSNYPYISFFREDTARKAMYILDYNGNDSLYLDFDKQPGDTISIYPYPSSVANNQLYLVDSVAIKNQFGIDRRSTYFNHFGTGPMAPEENEIIEGVGMRFYFPFRIGGGEWGFPGFTCRCYSQNDTVMHLYNDPVKFPTFFASDSCYKKAPYNWATATRNITKFSFTTNFSHNNLAIQNPDNEDLNITILNLQGQLIVTLKSKENNIQQRIENVSAGVYILSVRSANGVLNEKIFVQ